ncbi:MAG: RDD family protein [Verrucomicrobiota bacterium]
MSEPPPIPDPQEPYTAPSTAALPLASQWVRLGAQIIDAIIGVIAVLILNLLTLGNLPQILMTLLLGAAIVGINWQHLQNGQTIGKKLLKLKIVRRDGSPADRMHIVTRRLLPVWIVCAVPYLGPVVVLIDALCIFRAGRNTLHDDFAETKVVQL